MNENKGLKKNLGVATAMATVVGCVIGSGVFFKPQAIYTVTGVQTCALPIWFSRETVICLDLPDQIHTLVV